MGNFISQYAKDNRVESIIHITNMIVRAGMQIKSDKKSDTDYFVMSGNTVENIINAYQNKNAKSALVIDDLGLQVINRLKQEGVTDITLCLTRIPEKMFALTKARIKKTFKDFDINIISLEELTYMKVDLLISNPPYGKIGANITKKIIDTVDFTEYINLLPANDYKRNDSKDLFNYQSDMKPAAKQGEKAFADAAVTTHIAKIHKTKVNNMTLDEFERSQYIDRNLDKYFEENSKRAHYAIENDSFCSNCKKYSNEFTVILGWRDVNHKAMPKSKDSTTYKWNVEKSIDADYVFNNHEKVTNGKRTGRVSFAGITFNTATEKDNFVEFFYSESGRHFMSKLWSSMNVDGGLFIEKWFPKVDWTHSWMVEEILKDYGYTEDEIKTVMADLDNFKGMHD